MFKFIPPKSIKIHQFKEKFQYFKIPNLEEDRIDLLNNFIEELNIECKLNFLQKIPSYIFGIIYLLIIILFTITSLKPITIIIPIIFTFILLFLFLFNLYKKKKIKKNINKINRKYQNILSEYYLMENSGKICEEKEIILIAKEDLTFIKYEESIGLSSNSNISSIILKSKANYNNTSINENNINDISEKKIEENLELGNTDKKKIEKNIEMNFLKKEDKKIKNNKIKNKNQT